jgi:hypothetical protein
VQRHDIGMLQHLLGCGLPDDPPLVGESLIPGDVISTHPHVKGHGSFGDFPTDAAQTQQPEGFTSEFTPNPTVPLAPLDNGIVLRYLAGEGEEESKSVFGHGHVIYPGTEGHRNAQLCGGLEIHLVHANAILGQHLEARQAFLQHRACERLVAAEDGVVISNEGKENGLRQRPTRPRNIIGLPR